MDIYFLSIFSEKKSSNYAKYYTMRAIGWVALIGFVGMILTIIFLSKYESSIASKWLIFAILTFEKLIQFILSICAGSKFFLKSLFLWAILYYDYQIPSQLASSTDPNAFTHRNRYIFRYNCHFMISVIFHSTIFDIAINQQDDPNVSEDMLYMAIISLVLFAANNTIITQQLYFLKAITLPKLLYIIIESTAFQFSQMSLFGLLSHVGSNWVVFLIAQIFVIFSAAMVIDRRTEFKIFISLTILLLNQLCGVQMITFLLIFPRNDRDMKIFTIILANLVQVLCWVSLFLVVYVKTPENIEMFDGILRITCIISAVCFIPHSIRIIAYLTSKTKPVRITSPLEVENEVDQIVGSITKFTKSLEVNVSMSADKAVEQKQIANIQRLVQFYFQREDIAYTLNVSNAAGRLVEIITSLNFERLVLKEISVNVDQRFIDLICSCLEQRVLKLPLRFDLLSPKENFPVAYKAISQYQYLCGMIANTATVIALSEGLNEYCVELKVLILTVHVKRSSTFLFIPIHPTLLLFDLYDS